MQGGFVRFIGIFTVSAFSALSQTCVIDQRNDPDVFQLDETYSGRFGWVSIFHGLASPFLGQEFTPTHDRVAGLQLYVVDFPDLPLSTGAVIRVQLLDETRSAIALTSGFFISPTSPPTAAVFRFAAPVQVNPSRPYFFVPYVDSGDNAATATGFDTYSGGSVWNINGPTGGDFWFREFTELADVVDCDADGVPDEQDSCLNTPPGATVDSRGCSVFDLVPCAHPAEGGAWKNHGQYVAAVAKRASQFLSAGIITKSQRNEIVRTATRSDCGKRNHGAKPFRRDKHD